VLDYGCGPLPERFEEFRSSVVVMNLETQLIARIKILFGCRADSIPRYFLLDGISLEVRKRLARVEPEFGVEC
jgi:hypothetical protein